MEKTLVKTIWTGPGQQNPQHNRNAIVTAGDQPVIYLTSGDPEHKGLNKYIPEQLFSASLATAFMLSFLDHCAEKKVAVLTYVDESEAGPDIVLRPRVAFSSPVSGDFFNEILRTSRERCVLLHSCSIPVQINAEFSIVKKAPEE
ncbi:MAG: hypothetical protein INR69_00230 [Mucilaginibacter polytrichastri]|nr:hypothetical protein [Mucilaginibacter polytrichastri]